MNKEKVDLIGWGPQFGIEIEDSFHVHVFLQWVPFLFIRIFYLSNFVENMQTQLTSLSQIILNILLILNKNHLTFYLKIIIFHSQIVMLVGHDSPQWYDVVQSLLEFY